MKKYKILFSKYYEILSVTETNNYIPENAVEYFDIGSDMQVPDFVLVRAKNINEAKHAGHKFIEQWKLEHGTGGNIMPEKNPET